MHGPLAFEHRYSFIHSFILDSYIAPLQVHYYSEALPTQHLSLYCVAVYAGATEATVGEGLAKGHYLAVRAEFEPTTFQSTAIDSKKSHHVPPIISCFIVICIAPLTGGYSESLSV